METKIALYAYFGELGLFSDNIPGHTFYQLGLIDSISQKYEIQKVDFFNYIKDVDDDQLHHPVFPSDDLGKLMSSISDEIINKYLISYEEVLHKIRNREYSSLFLKARFRNLSTLQKKLKDSFKFENIIATALEAGYDPSDIVILDTDLSLSKSFLYTIGDMGIVREIPSITMPGISKRVLDSCLAIHENNPENLTPTSVKLLYYGNLSFGNYKAGHSKNQIINEIIESADSVKMFDGTEFELTIAAKVDDSLQSWVAPMNNVSLVGRECRDLIWEKFRSSRVSINVSKDLYLKEKFIPARVYESIIFGVIPVSYKSGPHPAMTFETVEDFWEICKFLAECTHEDYMKSLKDCAKALC